MALQLNPEAAEFIPILATTPQRAAPFIRDGRLDDVMARSPRQPSNADPIINVPSDAEFASEIKLRPGSDDTIILPNDSIDNLLENEKNNIHGDEYISNPHELTDISTIILDTSSDYSDIYNNINVDSEDPLCISDGNIECEDHNDVLQKDLLNTVQKLPLSESDEESENSKIDLSTSFENEKAIVENENLLNLSNSTLNIVEPIKMPCYSSSDQSSANETHFDETTVDSLEFNKVQTDTNINQILHVTNDQENVNLSNSDVIIENDMMTFDNKENDASSLSMNEEYPNAGFYENVTDTIEKKISENTPNTDEMSFSDSKVDPEQSCVEIDTSYENSNMLCIPNDSVNDEAINRILNDALIVPSPEVANETLNDMLSVHRDEVSNQQLNKESIELNNEQVEQKMENLDIIERKSDNLTEQTNENIETIDERGNQKPPEMEIKNAVLSESVAVKPHSSSSADNLTEASTNKTTALPSKSKKSVVETRKSTLTSKTKPSVVGSSKNLLPNVQAKDVTKSTSLSSKPGVPKKVGSPVNSKPKEAGVKLENKTAPKALNRAPVKTEKQPLEKKVVKSVVNTLPKTRPSVSKASAPSSTAPGISKPGILKTTKMELTKGTVNKSESSTKPVLKDGKLDKKPAVTATLKPRVPPKTAAPKIPSAVGTSVPKTSTTTLPRTLKVESTRVKSAASARPSTSTKPTGITSSVSARNTTKTAPKSAPSSSRLTNNVKPPAKIQSKNKEDDLKNE